MGTIFMTQYLDVEIYADIICPWCYIGLNILKTAIANFSEIKFDLIWRPGPDNRGDYHTKTHPEREYRAKRKEYVWN